MTTHLSGQECKQNRDNNSILEFGRTLLKERKDDTYIGLVISPLINNNTNKANEIRIIWKSLNVLPDDKIVLFKYGKPALIIENVTKSSGEIDTEQFIDDFPQIVFIPNYSIYSVSYFHKNQTVAKSTLQTYPTWMYDMKSSLNNLTLAEIFVPGSHLSGSYRDGRLIIYDYVVAQDNSVIEQLILGCRYFDIRVGFSNATEEKWWSNHDILPLNPLIDILNDIKLFLESTNEIVILDFHRFPIGFDGEVHKLFSHYIEGTFKNLIYNKSNGCNQKLQNIWESGRRLIISYNLKTILNRFYVQPPIKQLWGNKQSKTKLYKYFDFYLKRCSVKLACSAAMTELTPTPLTIFFNVFGSLRNMANSVNGDISRFLHFEWSECANIIAVDFFKSVDIVTAAIRTNLKRYLKETSKKVKE